MEPTLPPPLTPGAARLIKVRGWLLVLIGPSLCAGMAFLISWLTLTIHGHSTSHWNGSADMTAWAFGIFWSIFVFGVVGFVCGISLLRRGRVGPVLMTLFLLSLAAIIWYGYQILSNAHPA